MSDYRYAPDYRYAHADAGTPAVRRRRRGVGRAFVVVILVVLVILVVADRAAASVAAGRIEDQVAAELVARGVDTGSTTVQVGGFPFLTQVLRGSYDEITIDMREVRLDQHVLPQLVVTADGVQAELGDLLGGTARVVADRLTGETVLPWSTLADLVDYSQAGVTGAVFSAAPDGSVTVRGTANLPGGLAVPVVATGRLSAAGAAVRIRVAQVRVEGAEVPAIVQGVIDGLVRRLSVDVAIPELPFGLQLDQVDVREAGLRMVVTARSVPLTS